MPNQITASGIEVASYDELLAYFTAQLQSIYGADINIGQNTSDGQWINIFIQAVLDLEELLVQVCNGFDPDLAIGAILDQRVAINGIERQGGTFTLTNVTITVDRALTLQGLDTATDENPAYTVSDNAGNNWLLVNTQNPSVAGSNAYQFRAEEPGAVQTTINTITNPVTIVLGVTGINNPTPATSIGINEETDAELKIRRQQSTALSSQGYLAGLLAALRDINGVTVAQVYENYTNEVDDDGTLPHTIWVIVEGGEPEEIAQAIYTKRNAGAGMRGDETYVVTQPDGSPFVVRWDNVEPEALHIKLHLQSINGVDAIDTDHIKEEIVNNFRPGVYETVNINELSCFIQGVDENCLVVPTVNDGFNLTGSGTFFNILTPSAKDMQFAIETGNISLTVVP